MRTLRALFLLIVLTAAAPASFTPYLVKDVNTTPIPASSNPMGFTAFGRLALFQVQDFSHRGLWRSDGTASGTYRLLETDTVQIVKIAGDRCFFSFTTDGDVSHLGVTDGTLPGTFSLAEIRSLLTVSAAWVPRQGALYFASADLGGGHGGEIWRSDGTPGGTHEVVDLAPGPSSSSTALLTSFRGQLYAATDSALWRSDGTAAGTVQLLGVKVASIQAVGSRLVFAGVDSRGSGLWASDGTAAGTRRIADLVEENGWPSFRAFQIAGNRLYFTAKASAGRGNDLHVTDGTAQGTRRLTWFSDPGTTDGLLTRPPALLGNRLLFWASDPAHGVELWTSDGTPKGTRRMLDACPGACSSYASPLLQHRGRIYYGRRDESVGPQLWTTDGTAPGTRMVKDIPVAVDGWLQTLGSSGDRLFFATYAWPDMSVWTTDGTADGTVMLNEIWDWDITIDGMVAGDVLVFSSKGDDGDVELWSSDGTPAGTGLLVDIADEDLGGSNPHGLMTLGQSVLFFAQDGQGQALWRSDGTEAGTTVVRRNLVGRSQWTASATRVFFEATRLREALWTSDGTEAGTVRLTPPGVRGKGEISAPVVKLGNRVFFSAWSQTRGAEPWVTDGTPQGTRLLVDLVPGPGHSYPHDFTVFKGRAWFAAARRLWTSDGTAKGTAATGPGRSAIESLTVHAGRLWFLGDGRELWSTDGAAAGLRKIDLPDPPFRALLSDGARLYLADSHSALWASDGTAAGTRKISDQGLFENGPWIGFAGRLFYASSGGSFYTSDGTEAGTRPVRPDGEPRYADRLLRFGNRLIVVSGHEIWQSDGTAEGTQRVLDNLSPAFGYSVEDVVKAGPRLFFPGWEKETGSELWAMRE